MQDGYRHSIVHFGQQWFAIEGDHIGKIGASEANSKMELTGFLEAGSLQDEEGIVMSVDPISFKSGETNANLADLVIFSVGLGIGDMAVVEDGDGDDGARVEHFPGVLLMPERGLGVEDCAGADPFGAVLGDAVGVSGGEVAAVEDAEL